MYKKTLVIVSSVIALIFIAINIYLTQLFPAYFFDLVYKNSPSAAHIFLKKIIKQPYFVDRLDYFEALFGTPFVRGVFADSTTKSEQIIHYESLLNKNDQSRDGLIHLALLYFKEDNIIKAHQYYLQAKKIDPTIYISALEANFQ